jgi:hypothetical protein
VIFAETLTELSLKLEILMNGLDASEEAKPDERSVVKISQTVAEVLDQHVRMEMRASIGCI